MERKVDFVACDMPSANAFMINVYAAVAQEERRRISDRTKAGLAAAKARGVKLGGPRLPAINETRQADALERAGGSWWASLPRSRAASAPIVHSIYYSSHPLPGIRESFHAAQQLRYFTPSGNRCGAVVPVLEGVLVTPRCARRWSAVHLDNLMLDVLLDPFLLGKRLVRDSLGSDSDVIAMSLFYQTILQFVWRNGVNRICFSILCAVGRSLSLSTSTRPMSNTELFGEDICITPLGNVPWTPRSLHRTARRGRASRLVET
jgi:hypothetical protein